MFGKKELRETAEGKIRVDPSQTVDMDSIIHELRVHRIELEIQNEELRRNENELEAMRARYFDLYDLAPVGYLTIDGQDRIREANLTAAALFGMDKADLVSGHVFEHVHEEDKETYSRTVQEVKKSGGTGQCDLKIKRADGTVFHSHLDIRAERDEIRGNACRIALSDNTERMKAETVRKELFRNELLLTEVNHRVKNNMNSISCLLRMQSKAAPDPAVKAALDDSCNRIDSMLVMYDQLSLSKEAGGVQAERYFSALAGGIHKSIPELARIGFTVRCDSLRLSTDKLFPLGIIVNEILTNAGKYAFPLNRSGSITLDFRVQDNNRAVLTIADDGIGLSDRDLLQIPPENSPGGLGFTLIKGLTDSLGGKLDIKQGNETQAGKGTEISISFAWTPA